MEIEGGGGDDAGDAALKPDSKGSGGRATAALTRLAFRMIATFRFSEFLAPVMQFP